MSSTSTHSELVEGLWSRTSALGHFAFSPFKVGDTNTDVSDEQQVQSYRERLITVLDALRVSTLAPSHAHFKRAGREAVYKFHLSTMSNLQNAMKSAGGDPELVATAGAALSEALAKDESVLAYLNDQEAIKNAPTMQEEQVTAFAKCAYMLVGSKRAHVLIDNRARNDLFGGVSKDAPLYSILDIASAKMLMANRPLVEIDGKGNLKKASVIDRWQESLDHRKDIFGVTMKPGSDERIVQGMFNTWQGWSVEPEAGEDDEPFWDLLMALCNENVEYFNFVRKFLAHMVQRPEERPMSTIGISGPPGVGKSSLAIVIGSLMHPSHYNGAMTMEDITGRFTGSLATTLFGFLDEATWGGDKSAQGRIKAFITATDDRIEFKGVDAFTVPTYKRILFASNNTNYLGVDRDDRRLLPLEATGKRINKNCLDFWANFWSLFHNGKMKANLLNTLRNEVLGDWVPHSALQKLSLNTGSALAEGSMSTVERWIQHSLHQKAFDLPVRDGSVIIGVEHYSKPRIHSYRLIESYQYYVSQSYQDGRHKTNLSDTKNKELLRLIFGKAGPVTLTGIEGRRQESGRAFDWDEARVAFNANTRFKIEWDEQEPTSDELHLVKVAHLTTTLPMELQA